MTLLSGIKPSIASRIRRDIHWCLLARNQCLNHCLYDLAFIKHFCHLALSAANFLFGVHSWLSSFLIAVYSLSIFIASFVLLACSLSSFLLLRWYFWTMLGIVSSQSLGVIFVGWVGSVTTDTYVYNSASIPLSYPILTAFKCTWLLPQALPSSLSSQSSLSLCHQLIFLPGQKTSLISSCR